MPRRISYRGPVSAPKNLPEKLKRTIRGKKVRGLRSPASFKERQLYKQAAAAKRSGAQIPELDSPSKKPANSGNLKRWAEEQKVAQRIRAEQLKRDLVKLQEDAERNLRLARRLKESYPRDYGNLPLEEIAGEIAKVRRGARPSLNYGFLEGDLKNLGL